MLAVVTAIGVSSLLSCKKKTAPPAPPPTKVTVTPVVQETVPIQFEFSSTIQAVKTVQFIPRVTGYIMERTFVEGTFVKKDDLLYQIDPRPFEAELRQYQAQLAADQAQQTYQANELKRAKVAFKNNALSENELLQYETESKQAVAAVEATNAQITSTKLDLEYARITAPFPGRIQNTLINVGNLVTAEQSVLTTLVQIDPIYAVFNISRNQVNQMEALVHQGLVGGDSSPETWKAFKVKLVLPEDSAHVHEGVLNFMGAQINPTTDMLMARGIFANPGDETQGIALVPGQYARLWLVLGEKADTLLVPDQAIVQTQAGTQLYVVTDDNKVEARTVQLGIQYGTQRVIAKGVKVGEHVVTEGMQKIRPGVTVAPTMAATSSKDATSAKDPAKKSGS
jgi:RND family efflux transporter MFP subunit